MTREALLARLQAAFDQAQHEYRRDRGSYREGRMDAFADVLDLVEVLLPASEADDKGASIFG